MLNSTKGAAVQTAAPSCCSGTLSRDVIDRILQCWKGDHKPAATTSVGCLCSGALSALSLSNCREQLHVGQGLWRESALADRRS